MNIRTIFKNLKKNQILAVVSGALNIISMMLTAILIQRVFDSFSGGNYNDVKENSLYFLVLLALNIIFNYIFQYYYRFIEYTGSFPLKKFLLTNFLKSDYETSAKFKKGEMITAIADDSLKISEVYATGFIHMIIEAVQFFACLFIISYYNILIGIFCLTLVVIGIILTKKISLKIGEGSSLLQEKTAIEQSKIIEILDGLRIIKQLKKEEYFFKIYDKALKNKEDVAKSLSRNFALYADIYTFISNILPLLTILISLYFMLNKDMTIGAAIGIYSIVGALTEPISLFSNFLNNYRIATKIIEKDKKLLELEHKEDHLSLESLNNLNFSSKGYNFGEKRVLNDVQFTINKGEIIVIKGESGVGKSTIFNFINKFLKSDNVNIYFNEKNTKDISSSMLFNSIKEAGQHSITINDTIIENIKMGDDFSRSELDEIIDICQLRKLVEVKGENFIINENSSNISGGEKQRIAIARVLIRKPELILLDEPTSALDNKTAENFVKSFNYFIEKYKLSAIVITHRDDFTEISDMIVDLK